MFKTEIHAIFHFLLYLFKAKSAHALHSPFVFDLYSEVIEHPKHFYVFEELEKYRSELLEDKSVYQIEDFGAGSKNKKMINRSVSDIANQSLAPVKTTQLLFNLVSYFSPKTIVELGSSLGITTAYLSLANPSAKVYTFEGDSNLAMLAQKTWERFDLKIDLIVGNIDHTIDEKLASLDQVDFVWMDANHRFEPTMRYFNLLKKKATENTVIVLDDLYWSPGMTKAWKAIINDPDVTLTIDLYRLGMVFFRKKQPKQHFVLKF